jgi:hypothetical protein
MTIHEPMTMATDYMLCIAAAWFGVRLWRTDVRPWGLAFFFTAAASFLGGSYHGFAPHHWLWKATVYAIGLASFFLLSGAVVASVNGAAHRVLMTVAVAKFMAYATWMITHDNFLNVIVDYGASLLLVAALQLYAWSRRRAESAPWVLASIGVSILAAAVQQSRLSLHPNFNYNDLYHLIQLVALWLLYRGGMLLRKTETTRLTIRPT